eukprot:TRINITY_DN28995_c0_g1_i2.p1 TRINITY_DN28995_c0_g1~~TRINITY_DN28995_c0_g1_i2.p1  ORF type:complete len:405 (-),score=64.52 TRINITY_DN28995_c0_g1_i2:63-1277(-)
MKWRTLVLIVLVLCGLVALRAPQQLLSSPDGSDAGSPHRILARAAEVALSRTLLEARIKAGGKHPDCPAGFPYAFSEDRLYEGYSHCCSVNVSCGGKPLHSEQGQYLCCGGAHKPFPGEKKRELRKNLTYRYTVPTHQQPRCEDFTWWQELEREEGPLWVKMRSKAAATDEEDPTWAGADKKLNDADAQTARRYVGSALSVSGERQLLTAKKFMDVQPGHSFLEIGCGAFYAGFQFASYVEDTAYACVEPNKMLHEQSAADSPEMQEVIEEKHVRFVTRDDFDPRPELGEDAHFDRSWSHSILSHAADWQLMQYFEVMAKVLKPFTGVGMASIRFSDGVGYPVEASHDQHWIYPSVSYFDFAEARCMARRAGLSLELVPEARLFMTEVVPFEIHDWIRMRRVSE